MKKFFENIGFLANHLLLTVLIIVGVSYCLWDEVPNIVIMGGIIVDALICGILMRYSLHKPVINKHKEYFEYSGVVVGMYTIGAFCYLMATLIASGDDSKLIIPAEKMNRYFGILSYHYFIWLTISTIMLPVVIYAYNSLRMPLWHAINPLGEFPVCQEFGIDIPIVELYDETSKTTTRGQYSHTTMNWTYKVVVGFTKPTHWRYFK
jgi:hypothetical protein